MYTEEKPQNPLRCKYTHHWCRTVKLTVQVNELPVMQQGRPLRSTICTKGYEAGKIWVESGDRASCAWHKWLGWETGELKKHSSNRSQDYLSIALYVTLLIQNYYATGK